MDQFGFRTCSFRIVGLTRLDKFVVHHEQTGVTLWTTKVFLLQKAI